MIICGIDPGLNGGMAFLGGEKPLCMRVPVETYKIAGKRKKFIDLVSIVETLSDHKPDAVFIEKQQAMPGQGVSSTFQTGFGYGLYLGVLITLGIRYHQVAPRKWKSDLKVTRDKDQARARASELMPDLSGNWQLKCEDGVAEAAMIAYWGLNCGQSPYGSKTGLDAK